MSAIPAITVWERYSPENLKRSHEVVRRVSAPVFHQAWAAVERGLVVSVGEFVPR